MAAGTLVLFQWELNRGATLGNAQTVALTTMVLFQMFHVGNCMFHVGNCRSEHRSLFAKSPFSNLFLFLATAAALLIHIGALYFGPTQLVLRVEPLDGDAWLRIAGVAASILVAMEVHKRVRSPQSRSA